MKSFRYFNFMEDPIALSWAKSVHRTHNGTRRVSIISNDKETTWGEGEKERGLSKTSRGVRRSLLLSILSGKRREGGTSVEVDKFFYSRKAEKVTVPSLEGKKRRRKRKRWGTSNETGPRITMEIRLVPSVERVKYFIYFCSTIV